MFFSQEVAKLKYKEEMLVLWAWVSGVFSVGAVYKYVETASSGNLIITGVLLLIAFLLAKIANKIKLARIKLETKEAEESDASAEIEARKKLQVSLLKNKQEEDKKFIKRIKSRSLDENIERLNIKYKSLPHKEQMAAYGDYKETLEWLESLYK